MVCVCDCSSVSPDQLDIIQDFSRDGLPTSLVEIGREISVNFTVTNNGPSAIGQGRLTIYLPYRNPCTVNGFLFYITSVSVCLPYAYTYSCACLWYTYVLHMYIRTYVDMCIYSTHIHVCINSGAPLVVSHPLVCVPHGHPTCVYATPTCINVTPTCVSGCQPSKWHMYCQSHGQHQCFATDPAFIRWAGRGGGCQWH